MVTSTMNAQLQTHDLERVEDLLTQLVSAVNEEQDSAERVILHAEILDLRELRARLLAQR